MKKKFIFKGLLALLLTLLFIAGCSDNDKGKSEESSADSEKEVTKEESTKFPEKSISLIVPFSAGGTTDTTARILTSVISEYLPNEVNMAVVNKDGGSGSIGMSEVANANPDGYTIGLATSGPMTIAPHMQDLLYDIDSFDYIARAITTPNVLLIKNDAPWETYEDMLKFMEENPGEFKYGTSGTGISEHISMEAFADKANVELVHIPFEGGAPAIAALMGGHVEASINQSVEAIPHIESGELRAIMNTGSSKTEGLEDVPLLTEKGIDFSLDTWNGVVAPAGLPEDVKEILHTAFKQALEDPRVIEQFAKLGIAPGYGGPDEMKETAMNGYKINGEILKAANIIE